MASTPLASLISFAAVVCLLESRISARASANALADESVDRPGSRRTRARSVVLLWHIYLELQRALWQFDQNQAFPREIRCGVLKRRGDGVWHARERAHRVAESHASFEGD